MFANLRSFFSSPALAIPFVGLLFFLPFVFQPQAVLYSDYSDFLTYHLPAKRFLARSWQETGMLPLWCPYNYGGMPFIHDLQVGPFYPPHFPLYLLPQDCMGAAMSWLVVFHVLVAGCTMYAYARHQGLTGSGALVAALGYMFAGKWLLHILAGGQFNMAPLAWLPLTLLLLEQAIAQRSLVRATWAGLVFALITLGTHPQLTFYGGLFLAMWTLGNGLEKVASGQWLVARKEKEPASSLATSHWPLATTSFLGSWVCFGGWCALLALGLSAVQLLPAVEGAKYASRTLGVGVSQETLQGMLRSLAFLVGPSLSADSAWIWEDRGGLGLLWLVLAILAPVLIRDRRVRLQAGMCLVWVFLGVGGIVLLQWLPGFSMWRLPSRMLMVAALPIALLVGRTSQALASDLPPDLRDRSRRILLKTSAAILICLLLFAVLLAFQSQRLHLADYWLSLLVTVPVAWWLLGNPWRLAERPRQLLWLLILLIDLWSLTGSYVAVKPESDIYARSTCIDFLVEHRAGHGRILDVNPSDLPANCTPLWADLPMAVGIEPVRGYNPYDVLRYKEYLQLLTDRDEPLQPLDRMFTSAILGSFTDIHAVKNKTLADLLGVRYVVVPSQKPLGEVIVDTDWVIAAQENMPPAYSFLSTPDGRNSGLLRLPPYTIHENKSVLPRAFVVPEAAPLPEGKSILPALKATDFRRRVLLEDWAGKPIPASSNRFPAKAVIEEYLPNRVTISAEIDAPGYLVLTDVWFPGWKCSRDDQPVRVYRANYLFRAVEVPAGRHRVVFTFEPESYGRGKIVSGATAVAVLILSGLMLSFRSLRKNAEP